MDLDPGESQLSLDQRIAEVIFKEGHAERTSVSAFLHVKVTDITGQEYILLMARKRGADVNPTMAPIGGAAAMEESELHTILSRINPEGHTAYQIPETKNGMADLRVSGFTSGQEQAAYEQAIARIMKAETVPNIVREVGEELSNGDEHEWSTLTTRLAKHGAQGPWSDTPPDDLKVRLIDACLTPRNVPIVRPAETNRISLRSGKAEKTHSLICEMTVHIPLDDIATNINEGYIQVVDSQTTVIQSPFVLIPVEIAHNLSQLSANEEDEVKAPYTMGTSKTPVGFTLNALKAA